MKVYPGRFAVLDVGEYEMWLVVTRIPEGLGVDVLRAWVGERGGLFAVVRDPELCGEPTEPEPAWFTDEHRETAMAMLRPSAEPMRGDR